MALTKVNNRMIDGSYLNVKDFGATGDPGATTVAAETTAIQNAINYASKNNIKTVFFPDGHYKFTTLRIYYDSTDNSEYESGNPRDGRVTLLGCGRISISDLKDYDGTSSTEGRLYGTVLESTSAGDGVIVDPNPSFGSGSGNARNFLAEKITFVANNTGYVVKVESCPMLSFEYCAFKQLNNGGNGVSARNAWFFTFNNCFLLGPSKTAATGVGLDGSTGPDANASFGGLWSVDNSLIDTWYDCFKWTSGSFVGVSFRDTAIQNARNHSIHANGGTLQTLLLDNCYFENIPDGAYTNGVSFIKGNDDTIEKLQMNSCFMLGGGNSGNPNNDASAHLSGPCIDLDKVHSVSIDSTRIFRLSTTFLSINNNFTVPSKQITSGFVRNTTVQHDSTDFSALTTPIFLVKTGTDVPLPVLENNRMNRVSAGIEGVTDQDGTFQLYDSSNESIGELTDIGTGARSIPRLGVGEIETATISDDTSLSVTANTFQEYTVTTTNTGLSRNWRLTFRDDDRMIEGRLHVIKNSSSSTESLDVRNNTPSALINSLAPGETGFYIAKIDRGAANNVNDGDTDNVLEFELYTLIGEGGIVDGDFTSNGLMKRTGAGTYTTVTDNSANWDTAYGWGDHAAAGYTSNIGDITGVTAGDGLTGGGTSGTPTLAVASDVARTTGSTFTGSLTVSNALISNSRSNNNLQLNRTTTNGKIQTFRYNNAEVGSVSVTGSATTYNTTSDMRQKENIVDAPSASSDIDALQVRSFDWKADGTHQKYGMIAQELQTVAPTAVAEGDTPDEMMGVDFSTLVPMLIKEVQELRARVAELEASS